MTTKPGVALLLILGLAVPVLAQPDPEARDPLAWQTDKQGEFIDALCVDRQANLWVGTEDRGIWRRDGAEKWTHFGTTEGLAEDTVFCLQTDKKGRVWAGHSHGEVSVWNGDKWAHFDQVDGPLTERVWDIAVQPKDGSVWLATDDGLARYADGEGWSYTTALQGLKPAQIMALAFNDAGDLFAASACDGLWIARAADHYATWQQVKGPDVQPASPMGTGLPSNMLNDVAVDAEGNIWVATVYGIARSTDNGESWFFLRGKDWRDNVEGSAQGLKPQPVNVNVDLLAEDWVTSLAPTPKGGIWLSFREKGYERRDGGTAELIFSNTDEVGSIPPFPMQNGGDFTRAVCPLGEAAAVVGRYGGGVRLTLGGVKQDPQWPAGQPFAGEVALPEPARAPDVAALQALTAQVKAATDAVPANGGIFLGADWSTRGDWVGRLGDRFARLYATAAGIGHDFVRDANYSTGERVGPHQTIGGPYVYVHWLESENPNVLYDPILGKRRQGEVNDGSWDHKAYPFSWEGPDLWVSVTVGEGLNRVSLYHFNKDGHGGLNRFRDFTFHLKPWSENFDDAVAAPDLAVGRLPQTWNGGYAQFLVRGPGKYYIRMARDRSHAAALSGVFIDRVAGPATEADKRPMPWLGDTRYVTEPVPALDANATPQTAAAYELWSALDAAALEGRALPFLKTGRLLAYRAAKAGGAPEALLYNWRWKLGLWTNGDRSQYQTIMADAYQKLQAQMAKDQPITAEAN